MEKGRVDANPGKTQSRMFFRRECLVLTVCHTDLYRQSPADHTKEPEEGSIVPCYPE